MEVFFAIMTIGVYEIAHWYYYQPYEKYRKNRKWRI